MGAGTQSHGMTGSHAHGHSSQGTWLLGARVARRDRPRPGASGTQTLAPVVEGAWVRSLDASFETPTAEELPCSLVYPQSISWGSTRAACYTHFEQKTGVGIPILEEAASMPTVSSPRSGRMKTDKKQPCTYDGNECLERYLRDVRRYSVLSRASERALAKQIVESRTQWQEQLLEHLLHIPLLLAWRSRICQGTVRLTSLCRQGATPTLTEFKATLQRLRALRDEMRHTVQGQDVPQAHTVAPLQTAMRESLQGLDWHPEFLHQAWHRFHTAMTRATVAGQCRTRRVLCGDRLATVWRHYACCGTTYAASTP